MKGKSDERRAYWRAKISSAVHIKKRKVKESQKLARFSNIEHGFCNRFNTDLQKDIICFEKQLHSIVVIDPSKMGTLHLQGDAFVTTTPGLKIAVRTADCAPVLMTDGKVIATVHAGWKGAVSGVLEAALLEMLRQGANLNEIVAAVGPCIHEASYPNPDLKNILSEDVMRFLPTYPDGVPHFDLPGYVMYRLNKAGVLDIDLMMLILILTTIFTAIAEIRLTPAVNILLSN